MLTTPPTFGTSCGVLDLNSSSPWSGREKSNRRRNGRELNRLPPWSNANLRLHDSDFSFSIPWSDPASQHHGRRNSTESFQNFPNSQPISSGHDVIHTPASIFCLEFIITMVIVIFFAHERKLHQLTTHLNS